jgi:hypothetical protein
MALFGNPGGVAFSYLVIITSMRHTHTHLKNPRPEILPRGYITTQGRNAKTIRKLMKAAEAQEAGLLDVEIIGLRLVSGPQHVKYNPVL